MRMCTALNWSKMRSPVVGVCMDGDEAASGWIISVAAGSVCDHISVGTKT